LPELQRQLETQEKKFKSLNPEELLIKQEVTQDDIASVVARWTGVPVTKLIKSETDKLVNLGS
jgi:ATP-dependent Clp protease ATP-binding subunit ClpB